MAGPKRMGAIEWLMNRRSLRRWHRYAQQAQGEDLTILRQRRAAAQHLRTALDRVLHVADDRLGLPRIGSTAFARPAGTDWSWRPALWRGMLEGGAASAALVSPANHTAIGDELKIFHDCPAAEIALRQMRNLHAEDLAPYALAMDIFAFEGNFLSLALDLPPEALAGLGTRHLVRLDVTLACERPIDIYLRLNVQHGPNVAQLSQPLPQGADALQSVEFDLGYEKLNEKRIEKAWVDLIFDRPQMNRILLRDLTLARYPRAPL